MEKQWRGEGFEKLIHKGESSPSTCEHRCKCHRGVTIVCVLLCILTSLLALWCAVFVTAALLDVRDLRAEVKALHDVDDTLREAGAKADGYAQADIGGELEVTDTDIEREDETTDAASEPRGNILTDVYDTYGNVLADAHILRDNVLTNAYDAYNPLGNRLIDDYGEDDLEGLLIDEDGEDDLEGSGDDFLLLQDDEIEDAEDTVPRLVRRSAHVRKPRERKPADSEPGDKSRDKAVSNRKKGKGKKSNKAGKCRGGKKVKSLLAAQFEASVPDEFIERHFPYDDRVNTEDCRHVAEANGFLCRNRSFTPDDSDVTSMFHPSPWVKKRASPLSFSEPGVYTARSCGLYLVYAQVMFSDDGPMKGLKVEQMRLNKTTKIAERVQKLVCSQGPFPPMGLDPSDTDEEQVTQSCTVIGLFKLRAGDALQLRVRGPNKNTYPRIERNIGDTYFGVVQLNKDK